MSTTTEYRFVCPSCGEEIRVNEPMREALLEHGCMLCGTVPSEDHFETT